MADNTPLKQTISMYEYAKQVAAAETPMDFIVVNIKCLELAKYIEKNNFTMLLCRERNDYTIFSTINETKQLPQNEIVKEVRETLQNRGTILVIDEQEDGAYEIWIRDPKTQENFAYYLFNYNNGVIEV